MDKKIDKFLNKMHLLSLAVIKNDMPYCSSAFYAYDEAQAVFVIASGIDSAHMQAALLNPKVSGTVALDTKIVGKIKGLQFLGNIRKSNQKEKTLYFKRFFYAKPMNPNLFTIEISWAKFTDNSLGFGKKIIWQRN